MTSPEPEAEAAAVAALFRPAKKRKTFRHRSEDTDEASNPANPPTTGPAPTSATPPVAHSKSDDDDTDQAHTVASVLRLRQNRGRARGGGVAFRAGPSGVQEWGVDEHSKNTEQGMVLHDGDAAAGGPEEDDEDSAILGGINRRFAPQTGLVGELVNRHMEEYVESELARRKRRAAEMADAATDASQQLAMATALTTAPVPLPPQVESQRVMHGKLLEIDLGDEARARNIEMTERARRRLQGLDVDGEEGEARSRKPMKTRLGPDGKPWRGRKRRGSEDIKRDQLVDQILHENSLGVYDMQPEQPAPSLDLGDGETADDRIAEEFRREFMDAASKGRRRKAPAAPAKPGARKDEEVLKGPKLGGSRNARAAMRDLLLKEQEMKKQRR